MKDELFDKYREYVSSSDDISGIIAFANLMEQGYKANFNKRIKNDEEATQLLLTTDKSVMVSSAETKLNKYCSNIIEITSTKIHAGILKDYSTTLNEFKKVRTELDGLKRRNFWATLLVGIVASVIAAFICLIVDNQVIKKIENRAKDEQILMLQKEKEGLEKQLSEIQFMHQNTAHKDVIPQNK